jgi:hypothetical protein
MEDWVLRILLWPLPAAWRPALERRLDDPRFRGLMKLAGGLLVGAVTFLITLGLGWLTNHYHASALVGLPLAVAVIGLMEIVLGLRFTDLADRFDRGNILVKLGIAVVVLTFALSFLGGCLYAYQRYL